MAPPKEDMPFLLKNLGISRLQIASEKNWESKNEQQQQKKIGNSQWTLKKTSKISLILGGILRYILMKKKYFQAYICLENVKVHCLQKHCHFIQKYNCTPYGLL